MFNKNRFHIKQQYGKITLFQTNMPVMDGIVFNPITKEEMIETERFLIDTGAEMNILCGKYENLLKTDNNPIRMLPMRYLGSDTSIELPVYKVGVKIQGYKFYIEARIDNNGKFSLLGQDFFKNRLDLLSFYDKGNKWMTHLSFLS